MLSTVRLNEKFIVPKEQDAVQEPRSGIISVASETSPQGLGAVAGDLTRLCVGHPV